jgi:hypothetical protein
MPGNDLSAARVPRPHERHERDDSEPLAARAPRTVSDPPGGHH